MSCTDNFRERDYYREKIIELIKNIENTWVLNQILQFTVSMMKED